MAALSSLPAEGYSRLPQILGDPKAKPPIKPVIPISKTIWYAGIKSGRFPKPVYIGRSALWKNSDILSLLDEIDKGSLADGHK